MAGNSNDKPTNVRWLIFGLSCATSFILYLHRYTWGFVKANVQEEFGWSESQLGWLDGMFSISYGAGQIPSGILCDWFGPHVLLGSIILLWSLSMAGVAIALGYVSMAAARLLFGATQAGCYPTLGKVTKLWFPLSNRTSVQGWVATFFGRGGGAASFILFGTVLLDWLQLDWRTAIAVFAVVGGVFAIVFLVLFRNTPHDHPWANAAEVALVTEGSGEPVQATRSALRWSRALKSRNLRVLFVQQFTSAYADNVYVYWIPLFLLTAKGVETGGSGLMAAIPLIGGAVGGTLGGILQSHLLNRIGRRWARSLIGLVGKMAATIFMFVSLSFDSALVIVLIFGVVKFFGDWSQPAVWGTCTDIGGRNSASVFGTVNMIGSIAGFVAGPTMGLIIEVFSQYVPVQAELVREAVAERTVGQRDGKTRTEYPLEHLSVTAGTLRGTVFDQQSPVATFAVSKAGDFTVTPTAQTTARASEVGSRLDRKRGTLTIAWDDVPSSSHVVVDYSYTIYGSGWTALFIALGLIYLVSSLSWIWIDCTIPVDPGDDNGTANKR